MLRAAANPLGDLLGLIVAPFALTCRMKRDGNQQIQLGQPRLKIRMCREPVPEERPYMFDSVELEAVNRIVGDAAKIRQDDGAREAEIAPVVTVAAGTSKGRHR
jgi:hypothetical protein